jgi:hypothetical protein
MDHQSHVVHVTTRDELCTLLLLENGYPLAAAVHKTLPGTLVIHRHTQEVQVKRFGPGQISRMQHDMIDSRHF